MSVPKFEAAIIDIIAGTLLVIMGGVGALVRLGIFDFSGVPQWSAVEHWWPLLLIIVGLLSWLSEAESEGDAAPQGSVEMRYGK